MTSARPDPRRRTRVWQGVLWALLPLVVSVAVAIRFRLVPHPLDPVHEGRRLSQWMKGDPRAYKPAVQAIGTNALPYLMSELQFRDPAWLPGIKAALGRIGDGMVWHKARVHRYHARLALQILDSNAVPALLDAALARPLQRAEGDLPYEAAFALTWMASPEAKRMIDARLDAASESTNPVLREAAARARQVAHSAATICPPEEFQ